MSRCFSYPPPGFESKTRVNGFDVIESIKIENEKSKKETRKRKRQGSLSLNCDSSSSGSIFVSSENGSSQFLDLIENWIPPTLQYENMDFDDQEWLFETKQSNHRGHEAKRRIEPQRSSNDLWPCACYLPDIDIHVLPYTVLF